MTTFKVYVCAIDFRVVLLAIVGVVSARCGCSFAGVLCSRFFVRAHTHSRNAAATTMDSE